MRTHRSALALLLAASGCSGPLLYAEIEEPRVCVTLQGQSFEGVPIGATLQKTLDFDLASKLPLVDKPETTKQIRLEEMSITATSSSIVDFDGVQSVVISVLPPPGSTLAKQPVITYDRTSNPGRTLVVGGATSVELAPYVDNGVVHLEAEATGTLPPAAWTADVKGCAYAKVTYDYGKALGL